MANDQDTIWIVQSGAGPWTVVSKKEWVAIERQADFHNTMGQPDEPATGGFSGNGHHGSQVSIKYYNPEHFKDDPGKGAVIRAELERRGLSVASDSA